MDQSICSISRVSIKLLASFYSYHANVIILFCLIIIFVFHRHYVPVSSSSYRDCPLPVGCVCDENTPAVWCYVLKNDFFLCGFLRHHATLLGSEHGQSTSLEIYIRGQLCQPSTNMLSYNKHNFDKDSRFFTRVKTQT